MNKVWNSLPLDVMLAMSLDGFIRGARHIHGGLDHQWLLAIVTKGNLHIQRQKYPLNTLLGGIHGNGLL